MSDHTHNLLSSTLSTFLPSLLVYSYEGSNKHLLSPLKLADLSKDTSG